MASGDTDSSSEDLEAIPTRGGLRFGDSRSPSGSEFGTPRESLAGRGDSFISIDSGNFGEPSIFVPGHAVSMAPIPLQGPTFGVSILISIDLGSLWLVIQQQQRQRC